MDLLFTFSSSYVLHTKQRGPTFHFLSIILCSCYTEDLLLTFSLSFSEWPLYIRHILHRGPTFHFLPATWRPGLRRTQRRRWSCWLQWPQLWPGKTSLYQGAVKHTHRLPLHTTNSYLPLKSKYVLRLSYNAIFKQSKNLLQIIKFLSMVFFYLEKHKQMFRKINTDSNFSLNWRDVFFFTWNQQTNIVKTRVQTSYQISINSYLHAKMI